MKAGDIFEHPVKDTDEVVKLVAVRGYTCKGCIFRGRVFSANTHCISDDIGQRRRDITGSCSEDGVIYKLYKKTN